MNLNLSNKSTGLLHQNSHCKNSLHFSGFFPLNCMHCISNCDDLFCIYFFISQFKYLNFIILLLQSLFHLPLVYYKPIYKCNDQLTVGLLAQLVRALHLYYRSRGSNPGKPEFFRFSFHKYISCIFNWDDLLSCIYFFIPQFKYMKFIYINHIRTVSG